MHERRMRPYPGPTSSTERSGPNACHSCAALTKLSPDRSWPHVKSGSGLVSCQRIRDLLQSSELDAKCSTSLNTDETAISLTLPAPARMRVGTFASVLPPSRSGVISAARGSLGELQPQWPSGNRES